MRASLLPLSGIAFVMACSGSSGSGVTGTYSAAGGVPISLQLKSRGAVTVAAEGLGSSTGTYTVDGEKLIITMDGQSHTFIRDGNCIEDTRSVFGRLCKGGEAGAAANVSTRSVPAVPSGTWVAATSEGEFKLEFQPGNRLRLTATPPGGQAESQDGTFIIEGDQIHATLAQSMPMVLRFVNNTYESTSFGFPMTFARR